MKEISEDRRVELEDLIVENWYETMTEEELKDMYIDKKKELLSMYSKEEIVEICENMGFFDE